MRLWSSPPLEYIYLYPCSIPSMHLCVLGAHVDALSSAEIFDFLKAGTLLPVLRPLPFAEAINAGKIAGLFNPVGFLLDR